MEDNASANCCNLNAYSKSSMESKSAAADFAVSIETPDLRNWFSSYVYQSPELTSTYSCEDSLPIEADSIKNAGLYVEDSEGEEEEETRTDYARVRSNYQSIFVKKIGVDECSLHEFSDELDQRHKVPENSDSLPSQPPDIRNWFSSYVYESPLLDTAEIEDDLTPIKTSADLVDGESVHTDVKRRKLIGCLKSKPESAVEESGNEDQRSDLSSEAKNLTEAVEICGERVGSASCHKNQATKIGSSIKLTERVCPNEAAKFEEIVTTINSERDAGWILPNHKLKQGKTRANENENKASKKKKKHEQDQSFVVPGIDNGTTMTSRKPLMEISNEIAGKWRCPQKTKPYTGPPLKQLRLEKWIHRI